MKIHALFHPYFVSRTEKTWPCKCTLQHPFATVWLLNKKRDCSKQETWQPFFYCPMEVSVGSYRAGHHSYITLSLSRKQLAGSMW